MTYLFSFSHISNKINTSDVLKRQSKIISTSHLPHLCFFPFGVSLNVTSNKFKMHLFFVIMKKLKKLDNTCYRDNNRKGITLYLIYPPKKWYIMCTHLLGVDKV